MQKVQVFQAKLLELNYWYGGENSVCYITQFKLSVFDVGNEQKQSLSASLRLCGRNLIPSLRDFQCGWNTICIVISIQLPPIVSAFNESSIKSAWAFPQILLDTNYSVSNISLNSFELWDTIRTSIINTSINILSIKVHMTQFTGNEKSKSTTNGAQIFNNILTSAL